MLETIVNNQVSRIRENVYLKLVDAGYDSGAAFDVAISDFDSDELLESV